MPACRRMEEADVAETADMMWPKNADMTEETDRHTETRTEGDAEAATARMREAAGPERSMDAEAAATGAATDVMSI